MPLYWLSGLSNYILFKRIFNVRISLYDVLTLPFVVNLWGFLLPFQGSYIYNSIYFKAKYKIAVANTTSVYLVSFSISFVVAGVLGVAYCIAVYANNFLLLISIAAFLHPVFVYFLQLVFRRYNFSNFRILNKIITKIETIIADYLRAFVIKNILVPGLISVVDSLAFALWSYWIAVGFGFELSFFQLLILAFFIKITLLFKFTPGNLGINQFAASGIVMLTGGLIADGFTLSLYQAAIFIITSFLIGSVFSIVNLNCFFNRNKYSEG